MRSLVVVAFGEEGKERERERREIVKTGKRGTIDRQQQKTPTFHRRKHDEFQELPAGGARGKE